MSHISVPFDKLGQELDHRYPAQAYGPVAAGIGFKLSSRMKSLEALISPQGLKVHSTSKSEGGGAFSIVPVAVNGKKAVAGTQLKLQADESVLLDRGILQERFSASGDGIRQDFIIATSGGHAKPGQADLIVSLTVSGAQVEKSAPDTAAAMLTLSAGCRLVYNRLQVTDADWSSMNTEIPGVNQEVFSIAYDLSGKLYVGGQFTVAGNRIVNHIAKWNGSSWSSLGPGVDGSVHAIIINGTGKLYAGGLFATAGENAANNIAKWNG